MVAAPAKTGMFLVLTVEPEAEGAVRDFLPQVSGLVRSVSFRVPDDELLCVVGIGAHLWDRMYDFPRPQGLHPFQPVVGATHTAVATPGDLLIHLRATRIDKCFELAHIIVRRLRGLASVVDEVHGFMFFDDRDLLGFVDGTENPEGAKAVEAVTIGEEDPAYAGGSYVIVQKYLHDLDAWRALSVEEQERVIGRSKLEDLEMADDVKPSNSHVALNVIENEDGNQLQIVRGNLPFGSVGAGEFGTYFIGYAKDPGITEQMLQNMFIGVPPGNHDRILDFSTAHTGALFFVPSADFLDDSVPAPTPQHPSSNAARPAASRPDGSLGIGSLNPSAQP